MALRLSTGLRNTLLSGTAGLAQVFGTGIIDIWTGTPPANADAAETGTKLVRISVSSFASCGSGGTGGGTAGSGGLLWGTAANGSLPKSADTWSGEGIANGESGWWRLHGYNILHGTSSTSPRIDGVCGVSGADLNMSDLTVASAATITIDSFSITIPAM